MIWRCDLVPQYERMRSEVDEAVKAVLQSGRYTLADNVRAFEAEFSEYAGCAHGVGVNSGTDALVAVLAALELAPGDEVITTPFTAIPTYAAIRMAGGTPVFADIDPETYLLDPAQVASAVTERTRAVVAVHLFGNVVDVPAIREAVGPDVFILEDCAQAHGARLGGVRAGAMGDASAFSFYPTKNLGGYGDGGMVLTDDSDLAERIRLWRMYGMTDKDHFKVDGVNSRLDEVQAAILRVKLRHLDAMNAARTELAARYAELLDSRKYVPQTVRAGVDSVHHVYSVCCSVDRDALVAELDARSIQTNVYYPLPLYRQRAYVDRYGEAAPLPQAEALCKRIIALPFYPEMEQEVLEAVVETMNGFQG